jgi:hypothetical protein
MAYNTCENKKVGTARLANRVALENKRFVQFGGLSGVLSKNPWWFLSISRERLLASKFQHQARPTRTTSASNKEVKMNHPASYGSGQDCSTALSD